jgi:hydrogenase-4 component E
LIFYRGESGMFSQVLNTMLVVVLLLNFFTLMTSRLPTAIYIVGFQGVLIGAMPLTLHADDEHPFYRLLLLAAITAVVKGFVIPRLLQYAVREVGVQREVNPVFGFIPSLLLGLAGTGLALAFASPLPLRAVDAQFLVVPVSLSTVLTGFLLMCTRRRAISQALGYLVLENGIFIFGLLLVKAVPFLVEIGVLLDLFVGVFVMGIIIGHISRGFESDTTENLTTLKE